MEDTTDEAKAQWQDLLTQWYSTQPDGGTHSAAGWALRQWNVEPPINDALLRGKERSWTVTGQTRLTMIRIPVGNVGEKIIEGFILSDREITAGLFRRFVNDTEYQGHKPSDWRGEYEFPESSPAHPVQRVDWYDAIMFCNWLSWKEDRTPCYKLSGAPAGAPRSGEEYEVELIEGADGFRLPTEAEWKYACRAGATTRYSFGDDEATLVSYGVYLTNSNSQTAQVGTRLCNAWGLFDMYGNVWEWCYDRDDRDGSLRVIRGGSWGDYAEDCGLSNRYTCTATARHNDLGFRVARGLSSEQVR
jgi:hypothetical protein